jgi:small subunit ribosomal protein S16
MVKLRLRRKGSKHHPVYDIVAVDGRAKRDGAFLERLGYYDPNTTPSTFKINHERAIYWLNVGAQPTLVVNNLMSYDGVLLRRALTFKGKPAEEIEELVTKHKQIAIARYERRKALRAKRRIAKKKAEAAAAEKKD